MLYQQHLQRVGLRIPEADIGPRLSFDQLCIGDRLELLALDAQEGVEVVVMAADSRFGLDLVDRPLYGLGPQRVGKAKLVAGTAPAFRAKRSAFASASV